MANGGRITYDINFNVNKGDLKSVKSDLQDLQKMFSSMGNFASSTGMNFSQVKSFFTGLDTSFSKVQKDINQIGTAFEKAFNPKLNTINFSTLNKELKGLDLNKTYKTLGQIGPQATKSFESFATKVLTSNKALKESNQWLDKIKNNLTKTTGWYLSSSAINNMANSIQQAYQFTLALDKSLNNIQIVTKSSAEQMREFANTANQAAKALGVSTTDYTNAALIYYQQGLGDADVKMRADITSKVSNVTGQATQAVSEELTSLWNGYNVALEESEIYVDKLAAVAANSASSLAELATGMSKVASSASEMGVSADSLTAQLSTIVSTTRQAPESVGTALKTIYARISDIKAGLDDETSLGKYTANMAKMGVNVLDTSGKLKDMQDIIEEVGNAWSGYTREQQISLAQTMAGQRQYNNLMALFGNWDKYEENLNVAKNSAGELSKQQDIYMESAAAHIEKMRTSWEGFYQSMFMGSDFNGIYDAIGKIGEGLENIVDSLGGGKSVLGLIVPLLTKIFSGQIAQSLTIFANNFKSISELKTANLEKLKFIQNFKGLEEGSEHYNQLMSSIEETHILKMNATEEEYQALMENHRLQAQIIEEERQWAQEKEEKKENPNKAYRYITQRKDEKDLSEITDSTMLGNIINKAETTENIVKQMGEEIKVPKKYQNSQNIEDAKQEIRDFMQLVTKYRDKLGGYAKKEFGEAIIDLKESLNLAHTATIEQIVERVFNPSMGTDTDAAFKNFDTTKNKIVAKTKQAAKDVKKAAEQELSRGIEASSEKINIINDYNTSIKKDIVDRQKLENVITLSSSLGQVVTSMQTLSNIKSVISDDSLTNFEKLEQVVLNLSFTIPTLINSFQGFEKYLGVTTSLADVQKREAAYQKGLSGLGFKSANEEGFIEGLKKAKGMTSKIPEELLSDFINSDTESAKDLLVKYDNLKGPVSKENIKNAQEYLKVEQQEQALAEAHSASILNQGKALGKLALKFGAVAIAAAALYGAYKFINKDADYLKQTQEDAKILADAYDDAKNKYENFKKSIQDYKDAKTGLDGLVEGTQEWKAAVEDLNAQVLELINTYPQLAQYFENKDGVLTLKSDANIKGYEQQLKQNQINAQNASLMAKNAQYTAQEKNNETNLQRRNIGAMDLIAAIEGGALATGIGATIGTMIAPGIGTAVGAALGAAVGGLVETYVTDQAAISDKEMDRIEEAYRLQGDAIFKDRKSLEDAAGLKDASKYFDSDGTLSKLGKDVQELSQTIKANTDAEELNTKSIIENEFGDDASYAKSEFKDTLTNIIASQMNKDSKAYKDALDKFDSLWDSDIQEQYAKMMGWDTSNIENKTGYGIYSVKQGDNTTKDYKVSDEQARAALAQAEVLKQQGKSIQDYIDVLKNMSAQGDKISSGLGKILAAAMNGQGNETMDLSGATESQIDALKKNKPKLSSEELEVSGYSSQKDYNQAVEKGISAYEKRWNSLFTDVNSNIENLLKNTVTNLGLNQAEELIKKVNKAYSLGGQELAESVSSIYKGMSQETYDNFKAVEDSVPNWNVESVKTFTKRLQEEGIQVDLTKEQIQALISVRSAEIQSVESISSRYKELKGITEGLKLGDSISAEQYQTILEKAGQEAAEYFQLMLDGTYKLVGNARDLNNLIKQQAIGDLKKNINSSNEIAGKYNTILNNLKNLQNQPDLYKTNNKIVSREIDGVSLEDLYKRSSEIGNSSVGMTSDQAKFISALNKELVAAPLFSSQEYVDNAIDKVAQQLGNVIKNEVETTVTQYKDTSTVQNSLDDLKIYYDAIGNTDMSEQVDKWKQNIEETGKVSKEIFQDIQDSANTVAQTIQSNYDQIAFSAESYQELKEMLSSGDINEQAYGEAAIQLWEEERVKDLDIEEVESYSDYIKAAAKNTQMFSDELSTIGKSKEEIEKIDKVTDNLSKQILNMNDAVNILADNWENWSDILKKSSKGSEEYAEALNESKKAMSKLLDISSDFISEDLITKNMDDIAKAAKGDADAIDRLRAAALQDIILNIDLKDKAIDTKGLENKVNEIQNWLNNQNLEVGAGIDFSTIDGDEQHFLNLCNDLIQSAGLTADQVNALFGAMGFDLQFETEQIPIKKTGHELITRTEKLAGAGGVEWTSTKTYQGAAYEYTDYVEGIAMGTENHLPKITGVSKKATGAANNYSSSNSGGGTPGSSGGGGGSKAKEPDKQDPVESKKDRYHDVNIELKQIETNLKRIQKQEDKLTGTGLIDNINQQLGVLNKQIDKTKEKIAIANDELAEVGGKLAGQGVQFNTDGTIANYAAIYDAQLNYVNGIIAQYNAMDAESQEGFKDVVENAKKNFDKFVDDIERYDALISEEIPGLYDEIQEATDEEIELRIKAFNVEIDIQLNLHDAAQQWQDFKKKVIDKIKEDNILGNAQADLQKYLNFYNRDGSGTGIIAEETKHLNELLAQQQEYFQNGGHSSIYGDNYKQLLDDINSSREKLMEYLEEEEDLVDQIKAYYLEMMDEASEAFEDQMTLYEQLNKLYEHDMNVINLVYGEDSYEALSKYYQRMEDNYNKQLDFQQSQVTFWKQQMDTLEEGSDEWKKAKEEWLNAVDEWNSSVENAIKNLQDKYANAIQLIFQNINNRITDGLGLDYVEQEWELINKNADQYLDNINKMYKIQSLSNKYTKSINDTKSISAQQKLEKLRQKEMKALREKDKLTKYDVERAELKYQIALKQIALEEAQRNKSTMRLKRDSQGNYTYQYVADQDAIDDAKNDLSDLYNQLYNLDYNAYKGNLDSIKTTWTEYQNAMADAAKINDPEARAQREAMIQKQYQELLTQIVSENESIKQNLQNSTFENLLSVYAQDQENFEYMTAYEQELLQKFLSADEEGGMVYAYDGAFTHLFDLYDDNNNRYQQLLDSEMQYLAEIIIPQWVSSVQSMANKFGGDGEDSLKSIMTEAYNRIQEKTTEYEQGLAQLQIAANQDFNLIKNDIDATAEATRQLTKDNDDLIRKYGEELYRIQEVIMYLDAARQQYGGITQAAYAAAEQAYVYWSNMQNAINTTQSLGSAANIAASGVNNLAAAYRNLHDAMNSGGGSSNSGATPSGGGNKTAAAPTGKNGTFMVFEENGKHAGTVTYTNGQVTSSNIMKLSGDNTKHKVYLSDKTFVGSFDTGGYTGNWNSSDGKMAMLHEKELVLNKEDTENMLQAVSIVREIKNSLTSRLLDLVGGMTSNISIPDNNQPDQLEQNVHIDATFPNVTSSHEVEDALNNLTNIASQYINRKNK